MHKFQFSVAEHERKLENEMIKKKEIKSKIRKIDQLIDQYRDQIQEMKDDRQYYIKEYEKVIKSRSWKLTVPVRLVGFLGRKLTK